MAWFTRIPLGLIVMIIGFLMVRKTEVVISWFGRVPFAEDKFGSGGTYFFYKLVGTGLVFIGAGIATNVVSTWLGDLACLLTHCGA